MKPFSDEANLGLCLQKCHLLPSEVAAQRKPCSEGHSWVLLVFCAPLRGEYTSHWPHHTQETSSSTGTNQETSGAGPHPGYKPAVSSHRQGCTCALQSSENLCTCPTNTDFRFGCRNTDSQINREVSAKHRNKIRKGVRDGRQRTLHFENMCFLEFIPL